MRKPFRRFELLLPTRLNSGQLIPNEAFIGTEGNRAFVSTAVGLTSQATVFNRSRRVWQPSPSGEKGGLDSHAERRSHVWRRTRQPLRPSRPQGLMTTQYSGCPRDYGVGHRSSEHARMRGHETRGLPRDDPGASRARVDILAGVWRSPAGEPLAPRSVAKACSSRLRSFHQA